MVALAKERINGEGYFFVHNLAFPLTTIKNETYDVVLCALALHYLQNWTATTQEFYRVLKPGGCVVLSVEHPFNDFNFFKSKAYFATEAVKCVWKGFGQPVEVNSYRRPLQECITPFTDVGFYIDKLLEPKPTAEFEQHDARHYKELNLFAAFMCMRAVKRS